MQKPELMASCIAVSFIDALDAQLEKKPKIFTYKD